MKFLVYCSFEAVIYSRNPLLYGGVWIWSRVMWLGWDYVCCWRNYGKRTLKKLGRSCLLDGYWRKQWVTGVMSWMACLPPNFLRVPDRSLAISHTAKIVLLNLASLPPTIPLTASQNMAKTLVSTPSTNNTTLLSYTDKITSSAIGSTQTTLPITWSYWGWEQVVIVRRRGRVRVRRMRVRGVGDGLGLVILQVVYLYNYIIRVNQGMSRDFQTSNTYQHTMYNNTHTQTNIYTYQYSKQIHPHIPSHLPNPPILQITSSQMVILILILILIVCECSNRQQNMRIDNIQNIQFIDFQFRIVMLSAARRIKFRATNPKIMHDKNQLRNDGRLSFYPIVATKQTKTGIMMLNKPDNNNNITRECADEMYRFLSSYHHDHTVENVWIQNKGSAFSGGADYEELLHNPDYLDRLMRLSVMIGQFNKPIFAKVFGSVRGIGAYLLPMFSTPLGTDKSSLKLDETAKGFIPIFGGSHRLSRLPCNIGLYLALTGDKLTGDEMARIGFLKGKVRDEHTNKQIHRHLSNANLFMRNPYGPSSISLSEVRRENMIEYKKNYFNDMITESQKQIFNSDGKFYNKFALNQYRIAQTEFYNTTNPYNSFSEKNLTANNYFQMRHDRPFNYLKEKGIVEEGETQNNLIARLPVPKLLKVFNRDSVQGVLEELAKDGSEWAKRTEEMIRRNDPLAVHLTFHLIKKAQNLSWVQCLEEQYKIARRILNVSQVNNITTSTNKTLKGLKNPHSSKPLQQISQQQLQQFLKPPENDSQIFDHDTPNHSLLPTSDYWREIPDAGRNYLNRTFFQDYHEKFGEIQVVRFLNSNKIDYRDNSYSIPVLREYMQKKIRYDRLIDMQKQRIRGILQSQKFYQNLKSDRQKYLTQKLESPDLPVQISEKIKQYFQQKFNTRFDELNKTAEIAGKESRMTILRKYVTTLTENIVMNGRWIEDQVRKFNLRHDGIVRIDNKGNNVFKAENQVENSYPELGVLKAAYKNDRNINDLDVLDPELPKKENVFEQRQLLLQEKILLEQDAMLQMNYNVTILPRQIAYKYRSLMEKAAATSEQIAGLLNWENSQIQTMIMNAPKSQASFKQFAQKTLESAPKIQQKIQELNSAYQAFVEVKQARIGQILKTREEAVNNIFFDSKIIPRQFKSIHLGLFQQILNFYSQKYTQNNSISNLPQSKDGLINTWALEGLQTNFTKLMKSDVEYTFSYLVIIHLKEILMELQKSQAKSYEKIVEIMGSKFGVDLNGVDSQQFNKMFMGYMYQVLDMHEDSKHRIIFPQTKVIQFLNYFKLSSSKMDLRFEHVMLLIAKDRKMIRDSVNGEIPLLGYNPEINLNVLATQQKNYQKFPNFQQITQKNLHLLEPAQRLKHLSTPSQKTPKTTKKLVLNFTHYLSRFQAMLQQVASNTMFLPKSLYKYQGKQTYQFSRDLLKIQMSHQEWFQEKLRLAVKSLLDFRYTKEMYMSQGELAVFDREFSEMFGKDLLGLVIKYQIQTEEAIARMLISDEKLQPGTNDKINNLYLDIKSQVKNPRALRMLNNLIMTENVIRERINQAEQTEFKTRELDLVTAEQTADLEPQKGKRVNPRTNLRLANDIFRYADDESGITHRNLKNARAALGKIESQHSKDTTFLSELKQITKLIEENDFKAELENRIKRIEAL